MTLHRRELLATGPIALAAIFVTGCGGSASTEQTSDSPASERNSPGGIRLVTAEDGAAIQSNPPEGLVVLDVRTLEEFNEGHLEGATMLDFYRPDFAIELAKLDPDVPYLLYCRSGNRSGQTAEFMRELGFADVADVQGGILAWNESGLETVGG